MIRCGSHIAVIEQYLHSFQEKLGETVLVDALAVGV